MFPIGSLCFPKYMKAKFINEENIFQPKSKEEINKGLENYKGHALSVFRVYSGVDAFLINTLNDEHQIYLPYIDIIATNKQDAREKTALLLGQKLEDQDTNPNYENYVSKEVEFLYKFS